MEIKMEENRNVKKSICYCTNLRRSANTISIYYDHALKDTGLTAAQYHLLVNLMRLESANITNWAQYVGLERSTMVRNVKTLERQNLIELTKGSGKTFTLSAYGGKVLEQAIPLWEKAQDEIEEILGKEDVEAILRISEKLGMSENLESRKSLEN